MTAGWYDRNTGQLVSTNPSNHDPNNPMFNMSENYNWIDENSSKPPDTTDNLYRLWRKERGFITQPSFTHPDFIDWKDTHGVYGEWLSPEQMYQKRQFEALKNEEKLNKELEPFILESMGLQRDPVTGKIEKLPPKPLTPEQQFEQELENLYKDYLGKAQAGELPVSLATEKTLGEQEGLLGEVMSRKGGRLWREGTPGIKQQGNFMLTSEATKEAERHGDLNTAAGLLNQRQASLSDMTQRRLGLLQGLGSPTYSLVNAYGQGQQPYLFGNMLNSRQNIQDSVNRAGATAGKYQLAGSLIGAVGTGYALSQYNKQPSYYTSAPQYGQPFYNNREQYAVAMPRYGY